MKLLEFLIRRPTNNSINKLQAYVYPNECRALFKSATSLMPSVEAEKQREILNTFVRNIF